MEELIENVGIPTEGVDTLLMESERTKDFLYTICEQARYGIDKREIIKDIACYINAYYEKTKRKLMFLDDESIMSLESVVSMALNEVVENDDLDACVYKIGRYIRRNYDSKKYLKVISR